MIADNYSQKNHLQLNRVNFPACFNFQKISHLASSNGIFYLENWLKISFMTFRVHSMTCKIVHIQCCVNRRQYVDLYIWMWSFILCLSDCVFLFSPLCFRADVGEIYYTIPETGLTNRIIALFEHATQSENGTHCPLLWRMYLNFLVRRVYPFYYICHIWNFLWAQLWWYIKKETLNGAIAIWFSRWLTCEL